MIEIQNRTSPLYDKRQKRFHGKQSMEAIENSKCIYQRKAQKKIIIMTMTAIYIRKLIARRDD